MQFFNFLIFFLLLFVQSANSHTTEELHADEFNADLSIIKRETRERHGQQRTSQAASLSISDSLPSRHYDLRPFVNINFAELSDDEESCVDLVTPISRTEIYHTMDCVVHPATNQAPGE